MGTVYRLPVQHKCTNLGTVLLPAILEIEREWRQGGFSYPYASLLRHAHQALGRLYEKVSQ